MLLKKNAYPEIIEEKYYDGYGAFMFEISIEGLAKTDNIIDKIINNKIMAKTNEFRDLKNLDRLVNGELDPPQNINEIFYVDGGFMFKRMILAKLTGSSIYEEICALYKSRFDKINEIAKTPGKEYFLNYPVVFEKVYERLKNIEQLKNTMLSDKVF